MLLLVVAFCQPTMAAPAPSQADVDRWIAELGDDDYQVRKVGRRSTGRRR